MQSTTLISNTLLTIWEFDTAPDAMRQVVPPSHQTGWIAYICAEHARELALYFVRQSLSTIFCLERGDGSYILAGPHPASAAVQSTAAGNSNESIC